jgi:hypothetical protein
MATRAMLASDLDIEDRLYLPKQMVRIKEWKKVRYYRLPGTKGDIKVAVVEYVDGPMAGREATVIMNASDTVEFVLKPPAGTRLWKWIMNLFKRQPKKAPKEEITPLYGHT